MAFVFKAPRDMKLFSTKEDYDIGPGQYIAQTVNKPIKPNKVPFIIGSKKLFYPSIEKEAQMPGPGAYYHDQMFIKYMKNIQTDKLNNNYQCDPIQKEIAKNENKEAGGDLFENNLRQLPELEKAKLKMKPNIEKMGFLSKDKRFKTSNRFDVPGPGFYMKTRAKSSEGSKSEHSRIRQLQKLKQKEVVVSIPVKHQTFGYDILDNGQLVRNMDPEFYRTFSGERGDTVGPGSYEIDNHTKWQRTGTEWSKLRSTRGLDQIKKEEIPAAGDQKLVMTNLPQSLDNACKVPKYNNLKTLANENYKIRRMNVREMLKVALSDHNRGNSMDDIQKLIQKDFPGPGYYYDDKLMSSFKPAQNPEYKQFFGSNLQRFQSPQTNVDIGPGTYFNDDLLVFEKKKKSKQQEKQFAPFSATSERFFKRKKRANSDEKINKALPGPGSYDPILKCDLNKKGLSNTLSRFGSTEKRFADYNKLITMKMETPGPGSYIDPYSNTGGFSTRKNKGGQIGLDTKMKLFNQLRRPLTQGNIECETGKRSIREQLEFIPPVGTYNPDMIFSIDYNSKKKSMKFANDEVAFNSSKPKRKFEQEEKMNVGPGYYYKEKRLMPTQVLPPFRQGGRKFPLKLNQAVGPGEYNSASYFDWNKKTFNINFLK